MTVQETSVAELPAKLKEAALAVNNEEVQQALRILSKYGLGVCLPHMHTDDEAFAPLPHDIVQVEKGGVVTFQRRESVEGVSGNVPVAWRWIEDGTSASAVCHRQCQPVSIPGGGEGHRTFHMQS